MGEFTHLVLSFAPPSDHFCLSFFFFPFCLFPNYICKGSLQNVLAAWIKTVKRSQLLHSSEQISDTNKVWILESKALKTLDSLKARAQVPLKYLLLCSSVHLVLGLLIRAVSLLRTFAKRANWRLKCFYQHSESILPAGIKGVEIELNNKIILRQQVSLPPLILSSLQDSTAIPSASRIFFWDPNFIVLFNISSQAAIRMGNHLKSCVLGTYSVLVLELLSNTQPLMYLSSIVFLKFPSIITPSGKTGYREVKPEVRQPVCSTVSNWTPGSQAATVITVLHSSNL